MKKQRLFFTILLIALPLFILAQNATLNTSSFTASKLKGLSNGSVITLSAGTYKVTQAVLDAWDSGSKSNMTFKNKGTVVIDGTGINSKAGNIPRLTFEKWKNLTLQGLTFRNIGVDFNSCSNSKMTNLKFKDQNTRRTSNEKKDSPWLVLLFKSSNCEINGCNVNWTYSKENGKGIKANGGNNNKFINNTVTGRLTAGIVIITERNDKSDANKAINPSVNSLVQGGSVSRTGSVGPKDGKLVEDHGIYLHNVANVKVKNVTTNGWSKEASGHGIKIKGAFNIEVSGCHFKSQGGIIVREADNWKGNNKNIWLKDNRFDNFGINGFGLDKKAVMHGSIRIENNRIPKGDIDFGERETSTVNSKNALANKPGGVFNNCVSKVTFKNATQSNNKSNGCTTSTTTSNNNNTASTCKPTFTIQSPSNNAGFNVGATITIKGAISNGDCVKEISVKEVGKDRIATQTTTGNYSLSFKTDKLSTGTGARKLEIYTKLKDGKFGPKKEITINIKAASNNGSNNNSTTTGIPKNGQTITIKAKVNNRFVSVGSDGVLKANKTGFDKNEKFKVSISKGKFFLKSEANGKFVRTVESDNSKPIVAGGSKIGGWEEFIWEDKGNGVFSLKTRNGTYVQAANSVDGAPLRAKEKKAGAWEALIWKSTSAVSKGEEDENSVSVYPNPVNDVLKVNNNASHKIKELSLLDLNSKSLISMLNNNSNNIALDLSSLQKGVYILKIIYAKSIITKKIIKI